VLRCALTIDDAPGPPGDVSSTLMDGMRRALERHGVKRCVAFVIGERVAGHEAELERWLAAGYELGNHSHEHAAATHLPARAVAHSFERCHAELERLGAFANRRERYARLPFGDRGKSPAERDAIRRSILSLGYTLADVSINLHDFVYAPLLESALADNRHADAAEVERRFANQARDGLRRSEQVTTLQSARGAISVPRDFAHVIALHFVPGTERFLERLLSAWSAHVGWVSLADAVHHLRALRRRRRAQWRDRGCAARRALAGARYGARAHAARREGGPAAPSRRPQRAALASLDALRLRCANDAQSNDSAARGADRDPVGQPDGPQRHRSEHPR